jgi:Uma2 family endonuclease
VRGADILLVIEIAVTSLDYDLGIKAGLYARHGVQEYWVVAPVLGKAWVHSQPEGTGWKQRPERGGTDVLTPIAPELGRFHVPMSS